MKVILIKHIVFGCVGRDMICPGPTALIRYLALAVLPQQEVANAFSLPVRAWGSMVLTWAFRSHMRTSPFLGFPVQDFVGMLGQGAHCLRRYV